MGFVLGIVIYGLGWSGGRRSEAETPFPYRAIAVSSSVWHTLIITDDGGLWAFGAPWRSGLGDGTRESSQIPIRILDDVIHASAGVDHSLAITSDGGLWVWGACMGWRTDEENIRLFPERILENIVYATVAPYQANSHTSGSARSYAICADGVLWAWGEGMEDQWGFAALGDGTKEHRPQPVPILEDVVSVIPTAGGGFAITSDSGLWGWGAKRDGASVYPPEHVRLEPVLLMRDVKTVHVVYDYTFAIDIHGVLWALDDRPQPVMEDVIYATGVLGAYFAITTRGQLWGWGENQQTDQWHIVPMLGTGDTVWHDEPVLLMEGVQHVAISADIALVLKDDYTIWQLNAYGNAPYMLLEDVVDFSTAYYIDHGWVSFNHTFAVTRDGMLWGIGSGRGPWHVLTGFGDNKCHTPVIIMGSASQRHIGPRQ